MTISRKIGTAAFSALMLTTAAAHAESLTFVTFAGYYPPNLFSEFEAATGITVDLVEVATNEETIGKMMASNGEGFDLMVVSSPAVTALRKLDMLAEIDHAKIPNLANLYPEAMKLAYDPGLKYSVPYSWGTQGLCYRADLLSRTPDSWMDILDPSDEVKGRYTLMADERQFIVPAQLVSGLSVNDVSPEALAKIRPLLLKSKKDMLTFDSFTVGSRLVGGEIVIGQTFEGFCNMAHRDDPNVKYVVPKEGSDTWIDVFVIPEKAENREAAEKLIDFILGSEQHGWLVSELLYKVPNKAAMEAMDPALIQRFEPLQMPPEALLKNQIQDDLGADAPRLSQFVTEVMSAN